jgi:hypothetical protein
MYILLLAILCCCLNKKTIEKSDSTVIENTNKIIIFPINGKVYVASFDGLYLRSTGGIDGTIIRLLRQNTELILLERNEDKETIDGLLDYWYMVDTGEETGWVFGGYLFHKPVDSRIRNTQIAKMIAESEKSRLYEDIIMTIEGAILYYNNDTLMVYERNTKESVSFSTNYNNVFLIKIEETPGWYYLISYDYKTQGYIYLYDISENSYYGNLEGDGKNGPFPKSWLKTEYEIIKQNPNIKRYGPLLSINHKGKTVEFMDTRYGSGLAGHRYLLFNYYPEFNEILIKRTWWEGWENYIYNLEYEEYRCERIEMPYFNNTRTSLLSLVYYEDIGSFSIQTLKLFKINNGFYEEIFNENIDIDHKWLLKDVSWINDQEAHIDYGEAGKIILRIRDDDVNVVNNLVPVRLWQEE